MKGIIFTEFLDIIEQTFGLDVCQQMLDLSSDDGVYTAVGSYDHRDLVKLIVSLGKITDTPVETLQEVYGEAVFSRLYNTIPHLDQFPHDTFGFVKEVEAYIHKEVKKLYPDATPPHFEFLSETNTHMLMDYKSARCMSHVCVGLIKGCAKYFNQQVNITIEPMNKEHSHVRFSIELLTE